MARLCESVQGCTRTAVTTVPMFMGTVRLCPDHAAQTTGRAPGHPCRVLAGDYVTVRSCVGRVTRITPDGWYAVECVVKGRIRTRMVSRGMLRPV